MPSADLCAKQSGMLSDVQKEGTVRKSLNGLNVFGSSMIVLKKPMTLKIVVSSEMILDRSCDLQRPLFSSED